ERRLGTWTVKPMSRTTVTPISVVGRGISNVFLVRGDKAVVVDTGIPGAGRKVQAALAEVGVGPADVSAVVVTHGHIDHLRSAVYMKGALQAPIIAHQGDVDAYSAGHAVVAFMRPTGLFGWLFAKVPLVRRGTDQFVPDIVVDSSMSLREFGVDARILFT